MKSISWPKKTAKLNFMPLFLAMNFLLETKYFVGHETMEQDFQGIKFSTNSSQSISWAMKPKNKTWFAPRGGGGTAIYGLYGYVPL